MTPPEYSFVAFLESNPLGPITTPIPRIGRGVGFASGKILDKRAWGIFFKCNSAQTVRLEGSRIPAFLKNHMLRCHVEVVGEPPKKRRNLESVSFLSMLCVFELCTSVYTKHGLFYCFIVYGECTCFPQDPQKMALKAVRERLQQYSGLRSSYLSRLAGPRPSVGRSFPSTPPPPAVRSQPSAGLF